MQGLAAARRIRASRYLGLSRSHSPGPPALQIATWLTLGSHLATECSAKHNRGVQECFEESAKCAVAVRQAKGGTGWDGGQAEGNSCVVS